MTGGVSSVLFNWGEEGRGGGRIKGRGWKKEGRVSQFPVFIYISFELKFSFLQYVNFADFI